jgi:2,5-diamino-6-(ribosylamino)-4(3H)-pyrimidinone 5'-phosphate reductase
MGHSQEPKPSKRPHVILVAAMTLDGKIASKSGGSKISSDDDLKELHRLRSHADAVMIGIGTELNDNPNLTVRKVKGKSPTRIVVDSTARTPPDSRILSNGGPHVIVAASKNAPKARLQKLRQAGAEVVCCGATKVDLKTLLSRLRRKGIKKVLLEGGGNLNWSMLANGLVDEIQVTVAPLILGGREATTLVEGPGITNIERAIKLDLTRFESAGHEIVLNYKVRNAE